MENIFDRLLASIHYEPNSGCWLHASSPLRGGYGQVRVGSKCVQAHRLSYEIFVSEIPKSAHVLHKCDTPCCVNPSHLFIGDAKANVADMRSKGRAPNRKGEKNSRHKLSEDEVKFIKYGGERGYILAERFNVSRSLITRIRKNLTWKHV